METLVSVIIPTYNRPTYLKEAIESVMRQSFQGFEILVIDDGTPHQENETLCNQFPHVRYEKIENSGGPAHPRNIGASKAIGRYLAFLDDDDCWEPEKLQQQVAILQNHPDYDLVHTPCQVMDLEGTPTDEVIGRPATPQLKHGNVAGRMAGNWTLMTSSVLLKKSLFERVGGFNEQMEAAGEDTEFWTRCSFYGRFYYLETPFVRYRRHDGISQLHREAYFDLPKHLYHSVSEAYRKNLITSEVWRSLRVNIIRKQLKESFHGKRKTLRRLFQLSPFWYFHPGNAKLFVKKFILDS